MNAPIPHHDRWGRPLLALHRDNSVSYWSRRTLRWHREPVAEIPDAERALWPRSERQRIERRRKKMGGDR